MRFFGDSPVAAFISDASIDFTPTDFDSPLSPDQQAYLKKHMGVDIPQVFWRKQVHEDGIIEARSVADCRACPDADSYVTDIKGLPIAIRTADCVPVLIYDPVKHVIGLAHAGWKGTHKHIAAKTIQTMQDKYKCLCYDLKVVLGPAIRACCYEVSVEFKAHFPQDVQEQDGKLTFDIIAANRRQLLEAGVKESNITDSGICTCCDNNYHSFRRDGAKAGRMITVMVLL